MSRTVLMSPDRLRRTVTRLAYEVVEHTRGAPDLLVFGLRRRGVALAERLAAEIADVTGHPVPTHGLDVSAFRDDRPEAVREPLPPGSPSAEGRPVLIVDDVLFTGRTARAALDAVLRYGRPSAISLAVLIDRGHREVPVHPDFVGREIPTKASERVTVDLDVPCVYLDE
jgi:pyrimidine operon attenuation protein/uracil phosphoribosyltransferase